MANATRLSARGQILPDWLRRPRARFAALAIAIVAAAGILLSAIWYLLFDNLRVQWARTTPPFVGDLAVTKPRGEIRPDAAAAAEALAQVDLGAIRDGRIDVPRVFIARVPADLDEFGSSDEQKHLFVQLMLPQILAVNEALLAHRARLLSIKAALDSGDRVYGDDRAYVARIGAWYGVEDGDLDVLLRRVDVIPPSLAIAQAAEESGWGRSRFAREANALFGQHAFRAGRPSVEHPDEDTAPIRAFPDLISSISTYMHNLNTHSAYRGMRDDRASLRKAGKTIDGSTLAGPLTRYSERGGDYVASIRGHISANRLRDFDDVTLAP